MRMIRLQSQMHFVAPLIVAALMAVALVAPAALAQTSKGTLTGVVRDSSDAVIVSADVKITNVNTNEVHTTKTNSLGAYRFDAIAPGEYTLVFQSTGFERLVATGITILPSQALSYDPVLKLGRVDETISVSAETVLLDKEDASLSGTISTVAMANLPIFSLNPIEVLTTVPGVQIVNAQLQGSNSGNGTPIEVSGARPRSNNFMIDGEEINDAGIGGQAVQPQIPDMFSDTVVYTHNPPAEYGRASGGVVNMITKSGTNAFHGSAWDLYSGSGLDSTDGQTRQIVPKDRSNKARWDEHQGGFTAGGPIIKNKLFAFGASQWSRIYGNEQRAGAILPDANGIALLQTIATGTNTTTATMATLMLNYLSATATQAPAYLTTFNVTGSTTPATINLGAACPTETACSLTTLTYQSLPTPEQSPDTQWSYRIDYTPWAKDTFSARYLHDRSSLTPDFYANSGALPGFETYQGGPSELGQGTWTHLFSSKAVNEFRASETRPAFYFAPTAATEANPLFNTPTINITGLHYLGPNQNFPQSRTQQMYQFQDTVSLTFGRNTVRAGADIGRRIEKDLVSQNAKGTLNFASGGTGSTAAGNFLLNQLGTSGTATITFGSTRIDPHSWRSGIFVQDDLKVRQDLTLNLGVRYDYFTSPENSLKYPSIDPNNPDQAITTVIPVTPDKNNFAPRVGFAYTPHVGNLMTGNTVIRGGFGIFYDSDFTNIAVNLQQSAPNAPTGTLTSTAVGGLTDATSLIATIPSGLSGQSTVGSVVNNLVSPYAEEWNFGIDRQFPGNFAMSATYVGSHGVKLFANQQYNFFDFNTGERLDPTRGVITARANTGASSYNGLEVGLKHNMTHGVTFTGSYVYSKSLDNASEVFNMASDATSYSADLRPGGRRYDWGNSAWDHRQYLAFTYVWAPNGMHSGNNKGLDSLLSATTRHWTLSGSSRFQTGAYSTINLYGLDANGDGSISNDRPFLSNPSAPIDSVGIDGVYFGAPTTGTYYDLKANNETNAVNQVDASSVHWLINYGANLGPQEVGRNSYLNPGTMYNDIALEKDVPTSLLHFEHGALVFRAELQNFANHNNIGLYDYLATDLLNVGTSTFLNADDARESNNRALRFWAKFTF